MLLLVKLLKSSLSGVLKKSEIAAMKMEVRMKTSFIYRGMSTDEKLGEDWRRKGSIT